jgi:protein O-GlcNAc transferase
MTAYDVTHTDPAANRASADDPAREGGKLVRFDYEGRELRFHPAARDDHIAETMRRHRTFYEIDVLEGVRQLTQVSSEPGIAIDVGAFMGTHAVYFASFCDLAVLAYEPNPQVFPTLLANLTANRVAERVTPINAAVGAAASRAYLVEGPGDNLGNTRVSQVGDVPLNIRVATLDDELSTETRRVALVKIDVEGAELDVIDGARKAIARWHPILCVEVHTFAHLLHLLTRLRKERYCIVDCLGYSPTYLLIANCFSWPRRLLLNSIWLARALAPPRLKWRLTKLARQLAPPARIKAGAT